MKSPAQIEREKKIAAGFLLAMGLASAGLGIWIGINDDDWIVASMMLGIALLFPLAIFGGPWIDRNRELFINALETLGLLPKPTEAYMFVTSISLVVLFLFSDIWRDIWYVVQEDGRALLMIGYVFLGIGYSIYFAFSQRAKTEFEQFVLKYYSAVFLLGLSIATAVYAYETKVEGYFVLTAWNGIQATALLFLSGRNHVGEYIRLPTRDARRIELILGTAVVVVVLVVHKFLLAEYWVVALSTVLIAWSIVENAFHHFPHLRLNSPIMGERSSPDRLKEYKQLEKRARRAVIYALFVLVLGYLGFSLGTGAFGHLMGAAIGGGLGWVMAGWMRLK